MKKVVLILTILASFLCVSNAVYAGTEYSVSFGNWDNPLAGRMKTNTEWNYLSAQYQINHGKKHLGVDLEGYVGKQVYSIERGEIIYIYIDDSSTYNMSNIRIRYYTDDYDSFTVIYGHCEAFSHLKVGDTVRRGEGIGNITDYGIPKHLHFEIKLGSYLSDAWGQMSSNKNPSDYGWVSPEIFLGYNDPS
ncbi:MAG: M23 family metallopeptidase [Desulfobacteraceae bacterium]|nr:M23 family metallopeptidase [Desulfobacteraceae bacterium]